MIKLKKYSKDSFKALSLLIQTPHEDEPQDHTLLNIALVKWSWWFKIPKIIKPKEEWIEFDRPNRQGLTGYTKYTQKSYGFIFTEAGVHLRYGIQTGEYHSKNPELSDRAKVFWYPWENTLVRWDLLNPEGELYWRNSYGKDATKALYWDEILRGGHESKAVRYVDLEHTTKDGRVQKARIRLAGEEMEYRPKCTKRLPIFRTVYRNVDCSSNIELGERAGAWKGGLMGWSCRWEPGESLEDAFWRWYKNWDGS